MNKKLLQVTIFLLLVMGVVAFPIYAQESSPSPIAEQSLEEQIEAVLVAYRDAARTYRNQETEYRVAKEQFLSLQTLNSLEEAVLKTKTVMITRNVVLDTYLQLLEIQLRVAPHLPAERHQASINELVKLRDLLELQNERLNAVVDRRQLAEQVDISRQLEPEVERVAAQTLVQLSFSKMRAAHLQTVDVVDLLRAEVESSQQVTADIKAQQLRGVTEIEFVLKQVDDQLTTVGTEIDERFDQIALSNVDNFQDDLLESYANLSRAHQFIAELLGVPSD